MFVFEISSKSTANFVFLKSGIQVTTMICIFLVGIDILIFYKLN